MWFRLLIAMQASKETQKHVPDAIVIAHPDRPEHKAPERKKRVVSPAQFAQRLTGGR